MISSTTASSACLVLEEAHSGKEGRLPQRRLTKHHIVILWRVNHFDIGIEFPFRGLTASLTTTRSIICRCPSQPLAFGILRSSSSSISFFL